MAVELPVFEELDRAFVFQCRLSALERAEVPPDASLRIDLPRVQPIFARFQLANHSDLPGSELTHRRPFHFTEYRSPTMAGELRGFSHLADAGSDPPPSRRHVQEMRRFIRIC
jgi:hypothetical protein